MTLPLDTARCSGRMDLGPYAKWCEQRRTCTRFMSFMHWDQAAGVTHYRGVSVVMATPDCQIKIEAAAMTTHPAKD